MIKMVNDYEASIGIWNHKIGEIEHKIIPKEGDNLSIARVMKGAQKNGIDWLYEQFNIVYFNMVLRETPLSDEQKPKLKLWIEQNQVQIHKDMLVAFGWQTKEQQQKFENMDEISLKKLINT